MLTADNHHRWPPKADVLRDACTYGMPNRVDTLVRAGLPVIMGNRSGYEFDDLEGGTLLYFHLNGGVFNLGHRNPEVSRALIDGLSFLDIGNHHLPSPFRAALVERLCAMSRTDFCQAVLTPSATEANDVAIRSARRSTGRTHIVGIDCGFYGAVGLPAAVGNSASARRFLSDNPAEFSTVSWNDLEALETAMRSNDIAGVILETIPATGGFPLPDAEYLPGVRALCDQYGAMYIADEVQTGLGRTGHLWAIEGYGVSPDILVTGKGLGGGIYPVAATLLTESAGSWLDTDGWGYVSSTGGSELGCLVALKVLEITARQDTTDNVWAVTDFFQDGLAALQARHENLIEIRQRGLVIGLKINHRHGGLRLRNELVPRGVWAFAAGFDPSVLQFKPGLLLDQARCEIGLARVDDALRALQDRAQDGSV